MARKDHLTDEDEVFEGVGGPPIEQSLASRLGFQLFGLIALAFYGISKVVAWVLVVVAAVFLTLSFGVALT